MKKSILMTILGGLCLSLSSIANAAIIESVTWQGSEYLLITEATWEAAETEANGLGGHLVTIDSEAEHDFLWGFWGSTGTSLVSTADNLWIGINDADQEGVFVWASGDTVSYLNWGGSEPNNLGNEDYGHMWSFFGGAWNDTNEGNVMLGIVERAATQASAPGSIAMLIIALSFFASRQRIVKK